MGVKSEWAEAKEAGREIGRFVRTHDWKASTKRSFRPKYWLYWIGGIVLVVAVILLSIYHNTIVDKFAPHKQQILDLPFSWLIPVGILIVISFPPLGGHEVVLVVVGLIWGLGLGSAIAAAGTFLGELACFIVFRFFLTSKAAKIERKSVWYACLARLMRDGGLFVACMIRLSAVPGHVATAMMSTVGMSVWVYSLAVIVSIPKQLAIVYLGVIYGIDKNAEPAKAKQQKMISYAVFGVSVIFTIIALYYVYMRARRIYPQLLAERSAADEESEAERIAPDAYDPEAARHAPPPTFKPVSPYDDASSYASASRKNLNGMSQVELVSQQEQAGHAEVPYYEGGYGRYDPRNDPFAERQARGNYGSLQPTQPRQSQDANRVPFYTPSPGLPLPGDSYDQRNPFENPHQYRQ